MVKKLGMGCLGLLGIVVVLAVVSSMGGGGGGTKAVPTAGVPAAAGGSPARATEGPRLGSSRTAPVPFGQPARLAQGSKSFEVRVLEVRRDATAMLKKANQLNPDPKEGLAHVAIKMRLSYLQGPVDRPHTTPSTGASLFAKSRMWGVEGFAVPPSPGFGGIDIYPGATVDGWITPLQAPRDALDEIVLSWGKDLFGGGETWFALDGEKADAGPPPAIPAPPAPTSATPGAARGSPVPLGQSAKIGDGKSAFEVSVIQVERNASAMVKKANMFNPDPAPGMEYLAIKVRLKYLSGPGDKPVSTPSTGMSVFAMNRMWGTEAMVVPPSPEFGGQDIFPGAVVESWLTPVVLPKEGMDAAILSYGKDLFGGGGTWFALR